MNQITRPKSLFRYQRFSPTSLAGLVSQQIYFSPPRSFNDPHDCQFLIDCQQMSDDEILGVYEKKKNLLKRFGMSIIDLHGWKTDPNAMLFLRNSLINGAKKAIEDTFKTVGVCCFSSEVTNLLLWGHYADGHRGFCLEFETRETMFQKAFPVTYQDEFPVVDAIKAITSDNHMDILKTTLLTKPKVWEYEREWRVLHAEQAKAYGYGNALKGIYLGARMPEAYQQIILNLFCRSGVEFYMMNMDERRYSVSPAHISSFTQHPYFSGESVRQPDE